MRRSRLVMLGLGMSAIAALAVDAGCGGGGGAGGTGGSSGTGGSGSSAALIYRPCAPETRAGAFTVSLVEAMNTTPAFAILGGRVQEGVNPLTYLESKATEGDCRLMDRPRCPAGCTPPQYCGVGTQCITEPRSQGVGLVSVTGLSVAVSDLMLLGTQYNKDLSAGAYPPAAPGASVTLSATGGDYAPFTLQVRGIEPLAFAGAGVKVERDRPVSFTWTPPTQAPTGKILAVLNIAYHGGGSAQIECDLDDDGAAEIPAGLANMLLDSGTAGFPTLELIRRSVDSTTLSPPGCIQFEVSAPVQRFVSACPQPGVCVISCGVDMPCPTGMSCGNDKKCS
jgi:hypothetical protein